MPATRNTHLRRMGWGWMFSLVFQAADWLHFLLWGSTRREPARSSRCSITAFHHGNPELRARVYATRASTSLSRKRAATGTSFTTRMLDAAGLPDGLVREWTREVSWEVKAV